jgi:hypothetical protein
VLARRGEVSVLGLGMVTLKFLKEPALIASLGCDDGSAVLGLGIRESLLANGLLAGRN